MSKKATKKPATPPKKSNFFRKMSESIKNASVMADAVGTGEYTGTIDTGCYILNALVSGSVFGGIQNNKTLTLAGDPATGKTFIALSILAEYLKANPDAGALHMDTESATTNDMLINRGIDTERVILSEPITVEEFRRTVLETLKQYGEENENVRPPMMMILDSLGQLSTFKEVTDNDKPKEGNKEPPKDMTRTTIIKATFRLIRHRLAQIKVPMIVTNHIYANIGGYGPAKVISGGCMIAGTLVQMSDNSYKSIETIKRGELVETIYGSKKVLEVWTPETLKNGTPDCLEIEMEDGTKFVCSEEHSFLIGENWVSAGDLIEWDDLETITSINNSGINPNPESYSVPRCLQNYLHYGKELIQDMINAENEVKVEDSE